MALALNLSPREVEAIADEDPATYGALVVAAREKWTTTDELLAGLYEITHANYRLLMVLAGAKKGDVPEQIRVPRPGTTAKKKTATPQELAAWMRRRTGG